MCYQKFIFFFLCFRKWKDFYLMPKKLLFCVFRVFHFFVFSFLFVFISYCFHFFFFFSHYRFHFFLFSFLLVFSSFRFRSFRCFFTVALLPQVLRIWESVFYSQTFFILHSFLRSSRLPWDWQFSLEGCRTSHWGSKHRPVPSIWITQCLAIIW